MFLASSWENLVAWILLALNTAEDNKLSFDPLISYIGQWKKWKDIISCYFSIDLTSVYRAEWSTGKSLRHARAYQCYYCSSHYIQKARYQKHIEKSLGIPGVACNFSNQNLVRFEDNISNKGDLSLVAYMEFETNNCACGKSSDPRAK